MRRTEHQEAKRVSAEERQAEHNRLTTQEKWDKMMKAPGQSRSEMTRLSSQYAKERSNAEATNGQETPTLPASQS